MKIILIIFLTLIFSGCSLLPDKNTNIPINENESKNNSLTISEDEAVKLVRELPEVQEWLGYFTNEDGTSPETEGYPIIEIDSIEENEYLVHVYEMMPTHQATFDWYYVNMNSGEIHSMY